MTEELERKDLYRLAGLNVSERFKFVNHNEADYESFSNFQERMDSIFEEKAHAAETQRLRNNLASWVNKLPERWQSAKLKTLASEEGSMGVAARRIRKILAERTRGTGKNLRNDPQGLISCFYIMGESGAGKTYLAYAAIRALISSGLVNANQVKTLSENQIISLSEQGYVGRGMFFDIIHGDYKLFLWDGVGEREFLKDATVGMYEQLIDHCYTNSLGIIFTSSKEAAVFANKLSGSARSKFFYLVEGRELKLTNSKKFPSDLLDAESEFLKFSEDEKEQLKSFSTMQEIFD